MPSYLTFASTEQFRNRLLIRNLEPYRVPGVYGGQPVTEIVRETNLADYAVINSPDELISNSPFSDLLYPLNAYGPLGGYDKDINVGGLANSRSNLGPYDYTDAKLLDNSRDFQLDVPRANRYGSTNPLESITLGNIQSVPTFEGYSDPLQFTPSSYSPYEIILNDNPSGSDGTLSQDSFIAQLGAKELKRNFEWRIAREIERNTIGRINLLNAVGNPEQAILIASGKEPLIEKNWTITRPSNFVFRAADFIARLGGFNYPVSVIPGDYFAPAQNNLSLFGQIAKAFNGGRDPRVSFDDQGNPVGDSTVGKLFGRATSRPDGSQLFLDNTGSGQKSQLFYNLSMNRYGPNYDRSFLGEVIDSAKQRINEALNNPPTGQYYVGSKQLDASFINSPSGDLPVDPWGREIQSPVYGPDKLATNYEGEELGIQYKFGLNGIASQDGGGLFGGLIYTSKKYNTLGLSQRVGGGEAPPTTTSVVQEAVFASQKSYGFNFKQSSILDNTQRILDSTPDGKNRLKHAGNAINQLSKVFNDGYKEITKGSKVIKYSNTAKGVFTTDNIYCRVFAKDLPYYSYSNLQKTDGNIRKFSYSVLDKTYNLNIAPGETSIENGQVKKYMFSIENLAWRTSKTPGFTVDDLPACEKGPNGGRIMWFPPYDIKFSETSTPTFRGQDFLGRPEPIYTYTNTKRSGQLSWKILVDHPSILNVIAQKELKGNSVETNKIIDSFIAGCLKFDIYELARRWNQIPLKDLYVIQQTINTKPPTEETLKNVVADNPIYETVETTKSVDVEIPDLKKYLNVSYFFDNDSPDSNTMATTTTSNWEGLYQSYVSKQSQYVQSSPTDKQSLVNSFFEDAIKYNYGLSTQFYQDILKYFQAFDNTEGKTKPQLIINLVGSSSAVASEDYNMNLSIRRVNAIQNYIKNIDYLAPYINQIIINYDALGEVATVTTKTKDGQTQPPLNCKGTGGTTKYEKQYSPTAMACRKVAISEIDFQKPEPKIVAGDPIQKQINIGATHIEATTKITTYKPEITTDQKIRDGVSKLILRKLLNECDYFETIKESNPMFTGLIKERLKFFNPVFHSITPEGLNSRLTFLQQCMRPGDTIPTIVKNEEVRGDARNTAFGAPPVLVLRIGDFFNTKIIPQSLNITYEPLLFDLNPEGIGVQPMLANISLNFEIIGGEGLKGPIDKLQNALSFNFYANTEMYDERADPTDPSYLQIDSNLIKQLTDDTPPVAPKDAPTQLQEEGGDTIGTILNSNTDTSGTTGTISYQRIMDELHDVGQSYLNTFYGKSKEIVDKYGVNLFTYFTLKRLYSKGVLKELTTLQNLQILGKNNEIQFSIGQLFASVIYDVTAVESKNDNGNYLIQYLYANNVKERKVINVIKENLIAAIKKERDNLINDLSQVNQTMVGIQQQMVKIFRKVDFVLNGYDGFVRKNQSIKLYEISATTEVAQGSTATDTEQELSDDYTSAGNILYSLYNIYKNSKLIREDIIDFAQFYNDLKSYETNLLFTNNLSNCPDCFQAEKKFFMAMGDVLLNETKFEQFRKDVIGESNLNSNKPFWKTAISLFDNFFKERKSSYVAEHKSQISFFNKEITENYKKTYEKWNPYVKGKVRKFTFKDAALPSPQEQVLSNIYKDGNSNTNNEYFNGKNQFN